MTLVLRISQSICNIDNVSIEYSMGRRGGGGGRGKGEGRKEEGGSGRKSRGERGESTRKVMSKVIGLSSIQYLV